MTRRAMYLVLALSSWGLASLAGSDLGASPNRGAAEEGAGSGEAVVLVELFTSQGCSSCPPADRLLSRLAAEAGRRVVPLAFHVDYWDRLGWRDPFASAAWSARQRRYAEALGSGVYTPQLVVDGVAECVGSKEERVRALVDRALARPRPARVELRVLPGSRAGSVRAEVEARFTGGRPGEAGSGAVAAWVALVQDGLVTAVGRGENRGETLRDDRVVRRLARAFSLPATHGAVDFAIPPEWPRADLEVVAFLQDSESLAVLGAASGPVPGRETAAGSR
jgi:hypothetical protein